MSHPPPPELHAPCPPPARAGARAGYGLLLPTVSIVEQSMQLARQTLALALAGAAVFVAGLLLERQWLSEAHEVADDRHAQAQRLVGEVQLADERLTAAARMVVVTGEPRWFEAYDAHLPELDAALDRARALAPPAVVQRFDQQARVARDELLNLREAAFEALTVGETETARRIFDGERYRLNTARLATALAEYTEATVEATHAEVTALNRRATVIGLAALLLALGGGLVLWRRLSERLARSRAHFLEAEDRMQRLASSDLLTGLANRTALHDAMATALARAARDARGLAVLMIDLDRFKPINDRHGHMIGDLVLKEVALRLRRCLRDGDLQARYGGDEFVVVIESGAGPADAQVVARRIVAALARPMQIDAMTLQIGASVGIARYPADAATEDELLRKADSALYRAKARHRGDVCFYDDSLDQLVAERATLELALRDGVDRGEFVPHYQPIVDLASRQVQSLELLCRWQHPARGLLPPADFIALAEDSGQIGPIMISVLRQACRDLPRFPAHWRLSVNVASQQILEPGLVPELLSVLQESGVPPHRLDVELTESALVTDTAQARRVMLAMKEAGITVTLDDFGTGYSSLCYLAEMSFDKIKIDRSFVRTLHERPESAKIVDAVIGLSRSLGVQTVAEGVETERDAQLLLSLGCGLAQGYLFGRPLPAAEVALSLEAAVA